MVNTKQNIQNQGPLTRAGFSAFKTRSFKKLFIKGISSFLIISFSTTQFALAESLERKQEISKPTSLAAPAISPTRLNQMQIEQQSVIQQQNDLAALIARPTPPATPLVRQRTAPSVQSITIMPAPASVLAPQTPPAPPVTQTVAQKVLDEQGRLLGEEIGGKITYYVGYLDKGFSDLAQAINFAKSGEAIQLSEGNYRITTGLEIVRKNLLIKGAGLRENTVIEGVPGVAGFAYVGSGSNVTVENLTFRDFKVDSRYGIARNGGAFYVSGRSSLTVRNSIFEGNAGDWGGAIFADYSTVDIDNSVFRNNKAAGGGGAIRISSGTLNVKNTLFDGNTAGYYGAGAIQLRFTTNAKIEDSTFNNNSDNATGYGESLGFAGTVVASDGARAQVSRSTFMSSNPNASRQGARAATGGQITEGASIVLETTPLARTNSGEITVWYLLDSKRLSQTFTLSEGTNSLVVQGSDTLGNTASLALNITRDTQGPLLTDKVYPARTNQNQIIVSFKKDGLTDQEILILGTEDKTYSFTITRTDDLGNLTSFNVDVTRDTTGPTLTQVVYPSRTNQNQVIVNFKNESQADEESLTLGTEDKTYSFTITRLDSLGNPTSFNVDITRDTTPPTIVLAAELSLVTDQKAFTINYLVDGIAKQKAFTLKEGENVLSLVESDEAGNEARKFYWITLASQAPAPTTGTAYRLTTQNGDILTYIDDKIQSVQTANGVELKNLTLDGAGNIAAADLKFLDGSVQLFNNGTVLGYKTPDGRQIFYENGLIQRIISKDNIETFYSYKKDAEGKIIQTILDNSRQTLTYDGAGVLEELLDKASQNTTRYSNGIIERIIYADGVALFKSPTPPEGQDITVSFDYFEDSHGVRSATSPKPLPFKQLIYSSTDRKLKEILTTDDVTLTMTESGFVATDSQGKATTFDLTQSELFNLTGAQIRQTGLDAQYDAQGRLRRVTISDMTIHYAADSNRIDTIEKLDHTTLRGLTFDDAGNLIKATIVLPDGETRTYDSTIVLPDGTPKTYESAKLVKIWKPDNTEMEFTFNEELGIVQITKLMTPKKLVYNFNYQPDGIIEAVLAVGTPDALTAIKMQYDASFNLKKITRQNEEIINYLNTGDIESIIPKNEAPQVFDYTKDAGGKILSYTVTQGAVKTFYDAQNNVLQAEISPTVENPNQLDIRYQYGKIRKIFKNGETDASFEYTYSFDSAGEEVTTITESMVKADTTKYKVVKKYKAGNLETSFDEDTSVLSTYEYESVTSRVSKVTVTRLGNILHAYSYAYEDDLTKVTDEEGVVRTYGRVSLKDKAGIFVKALDNKLLFLEKDNTKYRYSYFINDDTEEITEEQLIQKKLADNTTVHYKSGDIDFIQLNNGLTISEVQLNSDRSLKSASVVLADGKKVIFDSEGILEEILPDQTHFFYENGSLIKMINAAGLEYLYSYDKDSQGNLLNIWVTHESDRLKYSAGGVLLGLKVSNILTPAQVEEQAVHSYEGGSYGERSHDSDYNTAQYGGPTDLYSTHTFPSPQTLTQVSYRFGAYAYSSGNTNNGSTAGSSIQVKDATTGEWVTVSGSDLGQSHGNGGGGGSTAWASTNGIVTLNINIPNVTAVRGAVHARGWTNGGGGAGGSTEIYELQYVLADQSFFNVGQIPQNLIGKITGLENAPYANKVSAPIFTDISLWSGATTASILGSQEVTSQEYSSATGVLEVQLKADHTSTLFENNKPSVVLDEEGNILIQYEYDSDNNIKKVYLKNARDSLPDEIKNAREGIESQRAAQLRELARQKGLAYDSIFAQADTQRHSLDFQLSIVQSQQNQFIEGQARGRNARNQRAGVLALFDGQIEQIMEGIAQSYAQEADAYAQLDASVKSVSDKIESDAQKAFTALAEQEVNLKKEILRQEISPIIYDHYRRILGRDPSSQEYDSWISNIDYNTGDYITSRSTLEHTPEGSSLLFDGNGDYITAADSPDWNFGTGDFTIETFVKFNSVGYSILGTHATSDSSYMSLSYNAGTWQFGAVGGPSVSGGSAVANTWYHVAVVRSGNNLTLYVNGTSVATTTTSTSFSDYSGTWDIGGSTYNGTLSTQGQFNGSIDGYRISKGIARYTANFTPSHISAESDSYTKLLLRGSGSIHDESTAPHPLTVYGNTVATSQEFAVVKKESWINESNAWPLSLITEDVFVATSFIPYLENYLKQSSEKTEREAYVNSVKDEVTSEINQYLAFKDKTEDEIKAKDSFLENLKLTRHELIALSDLDAQKILTWINSRSLHFGQSAFLSLESMLDQKGISYAREDIAEKAILIDILTGVISPLDDGDLVISIFALNKVAELYGRTLSGANLGWDDLQKIYDSNKAIIEDVSTTTALPGASLHFDGQGDYLSTPDSPDWNFGTGDFTVETWIRFDGFNSSNMPLDRNRNSGQGDWEFNYYWDGRLTWGDNGSLIKQERWAASTGVWYHLAATRASGFLHFYANGVEVGTGTADSRDITGSNSISAGADVIGNWGINGYMDGVRVSKGIARYTASFTPSTERFKPDDYTKLLLYPDGQSVKDLSGSSHVMTFNGDTRVNTSIYRQSIQQINTQKVIKRYPLSIQDPSVLTAAQIQDIIDHPNNYNPRVIAHINGNHYVVITGMTADSITYIDPGIGKDKENESLTVTKEGFLKAWSAKGGSASGGNGNVTGDTSLLNAAKERTGSQVKILSAQETQRIRGAFWGSMLNLLADILYFIPGLQWVAVIAKIAALVVSIVEGDFSTAVKAAFQDPYSSFISDLSAVAHDLFPKVYESVAGFINKNIFFFAPGAALLFEAFNLPIEIIGNTLVSQDPINFAVQTILVKSGVNPQTAAIIGSAASSTTQQSFSSGSFDFQSFSSSAIDQAVTIGTQTLLQSAGVDANLAKSISIFAGQSAQGIYEGNINNSFITIAQDFAKEVSLYGIDRLGTSLGMSPVLSTVFGVPISNAFAAQFAPPVQYTGQIKLEGQSEVVISDTRYRDERTGQIVLIPTQSAPERTFWQNTVSFFRTNFSDMIQAGINAYYASQVTPISIGQPNPSPVTTTQAPLPNRATPETYKDIFTQETKSGYRINSSASSYSVYDRQSGALVKRVSNGVTEEGQFERILVKKVDGSIGYEYSDLSRGDVYYEPSNQGKAVFKISDKTVQEIYIEGNSPKIVLEPGYEIDTTNKVVNGTINFSALGLVINVSNGKVSNNSQGNNVSSEDVKKDPLPSYYIFNGLVNNVPTGQPGASSVVFREGLAGENINPDKVHLIPLFEQGNFIDNFAKWELDANGIEEIPTTQAIANLRKVYDRLTPEEKKAQQIAVTYSGTTNPVLKAIARDPNIIVDTLISYGGPLKNAPANFSNSPRFKTFINVWGSKDDFQSVANIGGAEVGPQKLPGVKTINIKILEAEHFDFWYTEDKWAGRDNPVRQEINRLTAKFMVKLSKAAGDPDDLRRFLVQEGITIDKDKDLTVDLKKIKLDGLL